MCIRDSDSASRAFGISVYDDDLFRQRHAREQALDRPAQNLGAPKGRNNDREARHRMTSLAHSTWPDANSRQDSRKTLVTKGAGDSQGATAVSREVSAPRNILQ